MMHQNETDAWEQSYLNIIINYYIYIYTYNNCTTFINLQHVTVRQYTSITDIILRSFFGVLPQELVTKIALVPFTKTWLEYVRVC